MKVISGILKNVDLISENVKLRKYIEQCIVSNGGTLRINLCSSNQCDYGFKNVENECVYVHMSNNCIFVYVTNVFGREEVTYTKSFDGIDVSFNSFKKFLDVGNLQVVRVTEENTHYDASGILTSHQCHVNENTFLNGTTVSDLMYANYDRIINDYLIDDELIRTEEFDYHFHPELNRKICYVSDYKQGMFCSGDDSKIMSPRFMPYIGDFSKYESKIEENNSKQLKI